jgi:hypothetical protein
VAEKESINVESVEGRDQMLLHPTKVKTMKYTSRIAKMRIVVLET